MTLSLRARLLLGLVGLVLLGLVAADLATYAALQDFLSVQVDKQLLDGRNEAAVALMQPGEDRPFGPNGPGPGPREQGQGPGAGFPAGTYAERIGADGTIISEKTLGFSQTSTSARPVLPASLPKTQPGAPVRMTVAGSGGVDHYRALVESEQDGDTLVVAIPLTEVESILGQLVIVEASIGAGVLLALSLLGLLIIRLGLRPLERMGDTAAAIAGGDLTRRVEPATSRTEIGRLGLALNAMLSQIEAAFAERTASERRLRRFVADASHELRTPLTSIRGYAEMLRRGAERSPRDAGLARRRIEEETVRMSLLVDDLLLLARLDQGRPLERTPVDLQDIARDAFNDARAVAPGREITLIARDSVFVNGDDMRLRQVVGNLVRNALVHTPARTPVEIGLNSDDGHAILTVADHGPGLPAGTKSQVFERFYRGDPGRSRDRGGAGLGLSIVAAVVNAHAGEVQVSETPGGGATFSVKLPLLQP